jgi:hypothetical protein
LQPNLVLHSVLLLNAVHILVASLLELLLCQFGLLGFLFLLKHQSFLNFLFFFLALLGNHEIGLSHLPLLLLFQLDVEDFLLDFLLVALLLLINVSCALPRLLNFFPGLHFFLLQKSDTVSQHLGISVDTKVRNRSSIQISTYSFRLLRTSARLFS